MSKRTRSSQLSQHASEKPTQYCSKKLAQRFGPFWSTNHARRLRGLPKAEAAVLHSLCAHADKNGAGFIKAKTIAAETGYERNAISRGYKNLCKRGYVRRVQLNTASGQHGVYGYAVVMPLRLCETEVRYLDVQPCDLVQQHNNPIQQYNTNTDELFAFEASLMDRIWRQINFDKTPKMISVMQVSKEVFRKDPSIWPALKEFALDTIEELAVRLDRREEELRDWDSAAKTIELHAKEIAGPPGDLSISNASSEKKPDRMAEYLRQQLNPGPGMDRSLLAALRDIESTFGEVEIRIESVSLRTLDIVERECGRSLKKLAQREGKQVVLVCGSSCRAVFHA